MSYKRSDRVSELLRHEISILVQELKDPRKGFVTITSVHISDDLDNAKVYFSVFGSEEERQVTSGILMQAVPSIRKKLSRKLESLRKVPVLNFIYDDTPEKAQRVTAILNRLAQEGKNG